MAIQPRLRETRYRLRPISRLTIRAVSSKLSQLGAVIFRRQSDEATITQYRGFRKVDIPFSFPANFRQQL